MEEEFPELEMRSVLIRSRQPAVGLDHESVQNILCETLANLHDTHHRLSSPATNDVSDGNSYVSYVTHNLGLAKKDQRAKKRKRSSSPQPAALTEREKLYG